MIIRTKNKANAALLLSLLGVIFLYPYQEYFWGGLLLSGCLAALIGGLADWFAVTALFRKPLGIAYRTAIIPRNRERMLREIIDFTAHDLLNPANIMAIISRYDMTKLLLDYLYESGGKAKVKTAVNDILRDVLINIDKAALSKNLQPLLIKGIKQIDTALLLQQILNKSLAKKYDDAVINYCLRELIFIIREPESKEMLVGIIANIKAEYENSMTRRQLLSLLMQLSPEHLAKLMQAELIQYIEKLQDNEQPLRQELRDWLNKRAADFTQTADWQKWQQALLQNINDSDLLVKHIDQLFAHQRENWLAELNSFIDKLIEELRNDAQQQQLLDGKIKIYLHTFVNEQHSLITQMIKERMNAFSDEELVKFIEMRVADDLQMIRINGALVGSLVGMALYIITYLAERSW